MKTIIFFINKLNYKFTGGNIILWEVTVYHFVIELDNSLENFNIIMGEKQIIVLIVPIIHKYLLNPLYLRHVYI